MANGIHKRLNWRSGRIRLIAAAMVCAAGLGVGAGATTVLAQLNTGNPQPNTEGPVNCWNSDGGCPVYCANAFIKLGNGVMIQSFHIDADPSHGSCGGYLPDSLGTCTPAEEECGTLYGYQSAGCSGLLLALQSAYSVGVAPGSMACFQVADSATQPFGNLLAWRSIATHPTSFDAY